jgi:hypothetical protein
MREPLKARDVLLQGNSFPAGEVLVVGIEVGRPLPGYSRGLAVFAVSKNENKYEVRAAGATQTVETGKLWGFKDFFAKTSLPRRAVLALDAPITPGRPRPAPNTGRAVEKRFSRGAFSTSKHGLQPVSLAVHLQGYCLHAEAMEVREELENQNIPYMAFPEEAKWCRLRVPSIIEVLPRLTAGLLLPRTLVADVRPRGPKTALMEAFLFPYLFCAEPERFGRPAFPQHLRAVDQFAERLTFDPSFFEDAESCRDYQQIGAFLAAFQGVLAIANLSALAGSQGASEGYICVPRAWHRDWEEVWADTARTDDEVTRLGLVSDLFEGKS